MLEPFTLQIISLLEAKERLGAKVANTHYPKP
jgi:hypothetical protein